MRLEQKGFNTKLEAQNFVNEKGIQKENIVTFFQELDETYTLMYYAE